MGLENLNLWSHRMQGAIQLLCKMQDIGIPLESGKEGKVYSQAIYECLKDQRNMDRYLTGGHIEYYDHERNAKGKLIKVKAKIEY